MEATTYALGFLGFTGLIGLGEEEKHNKEGEKVE